jgi:SAM-dependent methyltransferase
VHTAAGGALPEPAAAFDFVFSNSVLEHIDDIHPVLAEAARVLRPGGRFLATVPSPGFHDCLAGPLLPWVSRESYLQMIDRRCAHRYYWSAEQWRASLARHGIELTLARPYLDAKQTRRWETLSRFTAGVLYAAAGGRMQPIEIQRALRLRRGGLRLPGWLAAPLAAAASAGAGNGTGAAGPFACLLVEGRRRP